MKKIIATIMSAAIALMGLVAPAMAYDPFCDNPNTDTNTTFYKEVCGGGAKDELGEVITNILKVVIGIAGLVAVVFIIIGGINYMTSTGDAGKIEKAKKTILYALIGLAVCALAFGIVNWAAGVINSGGEEKSASSSTRIVEIAKTIDFIEK